MGGIRIYNDFAKSFLKGCFPIALLAGRNADF